MDRNKIKTSSDFLKGLTQNPLSNNFLNTVKGKSPAPITATPSNPASTVPKPVATAPKTAISTPAAQNYIKSISTPPAQSLASQSIPSQTFTTPSGAVVGSGGNVISAPQDTPSQPAQSTPSVNPALSAYLEQYKLKNDQANKANEYLNSLILQSKKDQEKALESGETLGFASGEAARVNRNNAFAIEAATNAANAIRGGIQEPMKFGDTLIDPSTGQVIYSKPEEGYTLGEGQVRYDSKGNVIARGATKEQGFNLSPGESRFDSQGNLVATGGAKPITAAQEAKQIADQEKLQQAEQTAAQSIGLINSILPNASKISGIGQNPLNAGGLANGKVINEYKQLVGLLKLGVRGLIKGQGAVSDYEGRVLGEASSSLGRNLNNKDFESALKKTRGVLRTNAGQITPVTVTNPQTGESITADLSGSEIYHLVSEGNIIEYQ